MSAPTATPRYMSEDTVRQARVLIIDDEALLLMMERNGYPEETYYTFSYSPVPNDQGGTGGSTGLTRGGVEVRQAAATARQALLTLRRALGTRLHLLLTELDPRERLLAAERDRLSEHWRN